MKNSRISHCDKCGRNWYQSLVGTCHHPAVNKVYGENVCLYCCKKCRFHIQLRACDDGISGLKCGFVK